MSYFAGITSASGTPEIPVYCVSPLSIDGSTTMTPLRITQGTIVSSRNSSAVQIASGVFFTGQTEDAVDINAIQTIVRADQPLTMYVDQGIDGSTWDITDTWPVASGIPDARMTGSVAPYFRVRAKNAGSFTTSTFSIATGLTPLIGTLPRSLTSEGYLKVGVESFDGDLGTHVEVSPMGAMKTATPIKLAGSSFVGATLDENYWTTTTRTGAASATIGNGQMTLATGTTANGSVIINSVRTARYIAANPNYYRSNIRCPGITGTNIRRWGAFDANDGYFFEHNGQTLSLVCRKGTSDTNKVVSGSFNGTVDGTIYALDTTCHTYEIWWTNKNVFFKVDSVVIHTFTGSNAVLVDNQNLKIGLQCTNSGGNINNNTLEVRSSTINRLGNETTVPIYKCISTNAVTHVLKRGAGTLHSIVLNQKAATGNLIGIYDGLTAATGIEIGTLDAYTGYGSQYTYNAPFFTALSVVPSGGTNMGNITVIYE